MNGHIMLSNGALLDLRNPDPAVMDIEVIAHSLSQLCRFTGHSIRFYSVAEHSVLVSHLVPGRGDGHAGYALEGLLHDATEAFVGDMASPLKAIQPEYRLLEAGIEAAIEERFDVNLSRPHIHRVIKKADLMAAALEVRGLMYNWQDRSWREGGMPIPDLRLQPWEPLGWPPEEAQQRFLERYEELT